MCNKSLHFSNRLFLQLLELCPSPISFLKGQLASLHFLYTVWKLDILDAIDDMVWLHRLLSIVEKFHEVGFCSGWQSISSVLCAWTVSFVLCLRSSTLYTVFDITPTTFIGSFQLENNLWIFCHVNLIISKSPNMKFISTRFVLALWRRLCLGSRWLTIFADFPMHFFHRLSQHGQID